MSILKAELMRNECYYNFNLKKKQQQHNHIVNINSMPHSFYFKNNCFKEAEFGVFQRTMLDPRSKKCIT